MLHLRETLADLCLHSRDYLLVLAHSIEFGHELDERLYSLSPDSLAILGTQDIAKVVFESDQSLQIHLEVLNLHHLGLFEDHGFLASQKHQDLQCALLDQVDLALGALCRRCR